MNSDISAINTSPRPMDWAHLLSQGDSLSMALLIILAAMSVLSWTILLWQGWQSLAQRSAQRRSAPACAEVQLDAHAHRAARAWLNARHTDRLLTGTTQEDVVLRTMQQTIAAQVAVRTRGLTVLATVASAAPFVGLLGTVWGIVHALQAIAQSGAATLDKVAGPVGESLVMTAIGLAVAIPAAVGYNMLTRLVQGYQQRLERKAHDVLLSMSLSAVA